MRFVHHARLHPNYHTNPAQMCNLREKAHLQKEYTPSGNVETITPGTYYLTGIDGMFRRQYEVKA